MRVLLVTNDWPPGVGGIQTYLRGLVERSAHDIRVLAPAHPGAVPGEGATRYPGGFMWPTPSVAAHVAAEVEECGADVVWYGAPHPPALLGPAVRRRTGRPYMVLCHGAEVSVAAALPIVRGRLRASLRGAATVLAVSGHTASKVRRLAGREVHRLGVGVTPSGVARPTVRRPGTTVVSVGRLVPRKGHDRLIDAVAGLPGWDGRIVLIGDGPQRRRLQRRAARKGVALEVRTGLDDEAVRAALREADVFAQPCRTRWAGLDWEGLGIVFLEAAAEGLPVIAGRSGGAPEALLPGVTGFLAGRPGEIGRALALLREPERAESMGAAGRRRVAGEWGWDPVVARFDRWVEEAARGY